MDPRIDELFKIVAEQKTEIDDLKKKVNSLESRFNDVVENYHLV